MARDFIEIGQGPASIANELDVTKNELGYTHPDLHRYVNQQTSISDADIFTIILKDKTASKALSNAQSQRPIYLVDIGKSGSIPSNVTELLNSSYTYFLMDYHPELSMWSAEVSYEFFTKYDSDLNLYFVRYDTSSNSIRNKWRANNFIDAGSGGEVNLWQSVVFVVSDSPNNPSELDGKWDYLKSKPIQTRKIYFTNTRNWANVYVYYWPIPLAEGSTGYPYWPGKVMKFAGTDSNNQLVYVADVPSFTVGITFSDGLNIEQSSDTTFNADSDLNAVRLSSQVDSSGKYIAETYELNPDLLSLKIDLARSSQNSLGISEAEFRDTPKTYMIGVHNNHSYRTIDYHVHDEESTTCEIP